MPARQLTVIASQPALLDVCSFVPFSFEDLACFAYLHDPVQAVQAASHELLPPAERIYRILMTVGKTVQDVRPVPANYRAEYKATARQSDCWACQDRKLAEAPPVGNSSSRSVANVPYAIRCLHVSIAFCGFPSAPLAGQSDCELRRR